MDGEAVFDGIMNLVMPASKRAVGDADASAELIEALATGLGRAIARVSDGDRAVIERLLIGAEAHMTREAVDMAEFVRAMKMLPRQGQQ